MIATQLHLSLQQFLVTVAPRGDGAVAFHLDQSDKAFIIALAKREEGVRDGEKPCVFWVSLSEGYGRCGIYPIRPGVCRTYPAYLSDGAVHLRDDVVCPPRSWNLAGLDIPAWRLQLMRGQLQLGIYRAVVRNWNAQVRRAPIAHQYPLSAFYGYLMHVYARLASIHAALPAEDEMEILNEWNRLAEAKVDPLNDRSAASEAWAQFTETVRVSIHVMVN